MTGTWRCAAGACASRSGARAAIEHEIDLDDRRLAQDRHARAATFPATTCSSIYDENGKRQAVGSADVNAYLKDISGEDYTSKDFRTWAGTVHAARAPARRAARVQVRD